MSNGSALRRAMTRFGSRGLTVSLSSSVNVALFFVRNIMIARIVGPANFGVAVAIASIAAAVDVMSDLGWDKFLIQSDYEGPGRAQAQNVVHMLRLAVGAVMALTVVVLAQPLAVALQAPEGAPAIAALAAAIMFRSAIHVDYKHRQRDMDFKGEAIVETTRSAADLIAGVTAALILQNFWAMTVSITVGAVASFAASQIIARERYRPRWSVEIGRAVLVFGTPLVINNVFVYAASQGDRLLVGLSFGPHELAIYAAALTLVAGPQAVISRGLMMVSLPLLARVREDGTRYSGMLTMTGAGAVAASAVASLPMILFGPEIVGLAFGAVYHPGALLTGLLAVSQTINILRTWMISGLVANAKTKFVPLANVVRLVGFGAAVVAATTGGTLAVVAACLVVGEAVGFVAALIWHAKLVRRIPASMITLLVALVAAWGLCASATLEFSSVAIRAMVLAVLLAALSFGAAIVFVKGRRHLAGRT